MIGFGHQGEQEFLCTFCNQKHTTSAGFNHCSKVDGMVGVCSKCLLLGHYQKDCKMPGTAIDLEYLSYRQFSRCFRCFQGTDICKQSWHVEAIRQLVSSYCQYFLAASDDARALQISNTVNNWNPVAWDKWKQSIQTFCNTAKVKPMFFWETLEAHIAKLKADQRRVGGKIQLSRFKQ